MFRIEIYCYSISLLLFFCQICDTDAVIELNPVTDYKRLSLRIDSVVNETRNLKSELAETKAVVENIEHKIERIDANVSLIASRRDKYEVEHSKSLSNEKAKRISDPFGSLSQRRKTQAEILLKMLVNERSLMREAVEKFENKLKTFESDIKKQLTQMNDSFESSFDILNHSTADSLISIETSFKVLNHSIADSLVSVENKIQDSDNQTGKLMNEVNANFESQIVNSETKVSQLLLTVNSSLQSTNREISDKLNSTDSKLRKMSSKLDKMEETISSQISVLSSRIAVEEARKVAFSARMEAKQSSFGKREKIVFDYVIYSHGGGYNSSTGIFTAPKSGTYLFTFNVQTRLGKKAHAILIHEGKQLTRAIAESGDVINVTGGNAGIAYVEADEKVWVQTAGLDNRYYIWPYRTTFNGILID